MDQQLDRRTFIAGSILASAGAAASAPAGEASPPNAPAAGKQVAPNSKGAMPTGKIGKLTVSRLISGGNLISGWAHSRDLHYVANLMRAYNTEEKVMDTLQLLEEHGVNTIIADPKKKPKDVFARYWKERGGKMQWIAEGHPDAEDIKTDLQKSIDFGAAAVYVQGVKSDIFLKQNKFELVGRCVDYVQSQGVPAGVGAHKLDVIVESERLNFGPDFYVKTLHHTKYWSARRADQEKDVVENPADNYWDMEPEKTIEFMKGVKRPWIAFKTLAAGAIKPESGFRYALQNGADFICVGMFDFQVEQNVGLARKFVDEFQKRDRAWQA
jgi:hypothetical protein